jgi:hypothetical protein
MEHINYQQNDPFDSLDKNKNTGDGSEKQITGVTKEEGGKK